MDEDETVVGAGELDSSDGHTTARSGSRHRYLLVVDSHGSRRIRLHDAGVVVIGRAVDADVRLYDELASRRHAKLELGDGPPTLVDLDSQNGTRIGGERISGPRVVRPGEVISIGAATLVYQARHSTVMTPIAVSLDALMQRGEQELERALRFQRPLTVVALRIPDAAAHRDDVQGALARSIRSIDVFGWAEEDELVLLMPELTADDGFEVTGRLLRALSPISPRVRGGFSTGPADADDMAALLDLARAGTLNSTASAGEVVGSTFRALTIAGRSIVVADSAMLGIYQLAERLAASELPVLVHGETGTGKELVASAIHAWSARKGGPFVAVNCGAFPDGLAEAELFGHEKGAFTGATATRKGVFERAEGGTVFLDEVGELSATAQAALLRVLETRRVSRLGGDRELPVDFRLVSATNRDLARVASSAQYRLDLFYRLGAAVIRIPPLRDRFRELPVLAQALLETACRDAARPPKVLSRDATLLCGRYPWPGNVRELKHVMAYLAATVESSVIEPHHVEAVLDRDRLAEPLAPPNLSAPDVHDDVPDGEPAGFRPLYDELAELERERIRAALEATGGNQTRAAALLMIPLRTFQAKIKQHQLHASGPRDDRRTKKR